MTKEIIDSLPIFFFSFFPAYPQLLSSLSSDNFGAALDGNVIRSAEPLGACCALRCLNGECESSYMVPMLRVNFDFQHPAAAALFLVPSCCSICSRLVQKTICRLLHTQMEQSMDQHFLCDQMSTILYRPVISCFFNTTPRHWIIYRSPTPLFIYFPTDHGGLRKRKRKSKFRMDISSFD